MFKIKKITGDLSIFTFDILTLVYQTIRQMVLPNKRRKGNLLSSIFLFFMSLAERIALLRKQLQSTLRVRPLPHSRKYMNYLRQGFILATCLLFVLSLYEWTSGIETFPASKQISTEQSQQLPELRTDTSVVKRLKLTILLKKYFSPFPVCVAGVLFFPYRRTREADLCLMYQVFRI